MLIFLPQRNTRRVEHLLHRPVVGKVLLNAADCLRIWDIQGAKYLIGPFSKGLTIYSILVPSQPVTVLLLSDLLGVGEIEAPTKNLCTFASTDSLSGELVEVVRGTVPCGHIPQALNYRAFLLAAYHLVMGHRENSSDVTVSELNLDTHAACEVADNGSDLAKERDFKTPTL